MTRQRRLVLALAPVLVAAGVAVAAFAADGAQELAVPLMPVLSPAPPPVASSAPAPAVVAPPAPAPVAPAPTAQANKPSVSTQAPIRPAQVRNAPATRAEAKPTWVELSTQQQEALAPLSASWRSLGESHKRKWLALSQNYHSMPPGEQARLHSRMAEWVALSPQQRTLARLNFAETQKVNPDDKRAKWEAYQRLSAEEKRKLAARAAATKPPPPPTALAVRPVPPQKLARIPKPKRPENTAKIDNNTLLPQPPAPVQP